MAYPNSVFFEVASVVIDAIRMFEFTKETYFFEYVLPFLQGLFTAIGHLFDGHDLVGDVIACIVNGSEAAMPNFTEIVEQLFGILGLEKRCYIWVFEAARPRKNKGRDTFLKIWFDRIFYGTHDVQTYITASKI